MILLFGEIIILIGKYLHNFTLHDKQKKKKKKIAELNFYNIKHTRRANPIVFRQFDINYNYFNF